MRLTCRCSSGVSMGSWNRNVIQKRAHQIVGGHVVGLGLERDLWVTLPRGRYEELQAFLDVDSDGEVEFVLIEDFIRYATVIARREGTLRRLWLEVWEPEGEHGALPSAEQAVVVRVKKSRPSWLSSLFSCWACAARSRRILTRREGAAGSAV